MRSSPRLVSVVMPVRHADTHTRSQLTALAGQRYAGNWELVVAHSHRTGDTAKTLADWLLALPNARLVDAVGDTRNPSSRARNRAAMEAKGDFLAFCDADDLVTDRWLEALVRGAAYGDIVAGRLDCERLNSSSIRLRHATPPWERSHPIHHFLPHVSTANCGVWSDVFHSLGGFDEHIARAEDRDFAWRAQLAGATVHAAQDAVIAYRYRTRLSAAARQQYRWGSSNPALFRAFGPSGMSRTRASDSARAWSWLLCTMPLVPLSANRRGQWVVRAAYQAGQLVGSARERVLFL